MTRRINGMSLFIVLVLLNVSESFAVWPPENYVGHITQDGEYFWLSTYFGLVKFQKATGSTTWFSTKNSGLPNDHVKATVVGPDTKLYVTTEAGEAGGFAIFDGARWETVLLDDERNSFRDVKFDSQGNLWVLGTRDIHRFDGTIWKKYATMMGGDSGTNIEFDFQSDGTVWIVRDGITQLKGDTVSFINTGLPFFLPFSIAIGPDDGVWFGCISDLGHDGELVKTNGTDWFTYNAGNTNFPGGSIYCLDFDNNGKLWAGGNRWAGTFDGTSWAVYDSTDCDYLKDASVRDLLVEDNGTLWLGTHDHGLLKFDGTTWTQYDVIPAATGIMEEKPAEIELSPAYPNPFNPKTTIGFSLPESGRMTLTVYDVAGRKVATLFEKVLAAGRHEVVFDGSGLASGLYFYRVQTEGIAKTGKMLLIK